MQARKLTAAQGWRWIPEAFAIFRKAPSRLGMVVMGYWLCVLLLNTIPIIGPLLTSILIPALSVGVMNAVRLVERDQTIEARILFSGFKENRKTLLTLGALNLACTFVALGLSVIADEGLLLSVMTGQQVLSEEVFNNPDISLAAAIVLTVLLPLMMAYWYAPMLSSWYGLSLPKSLFFSFVACARNWQAFLAFSVSLLLYGIVLPVTALSLLVSAIPAAASFISALVLMPLLMVFAPTVMASFYVSYRDVFAVSENA